MKTYSETYLKARLAQVVVSAADELTGGSWRHGMKREAQSPSDTASGVLGSLSAMLGGWSRVVALAGVLGVSVFMLPYLMGKKFTGWLRGVATGDKEQGVSAPYRDIQRLPKDGMPGTDKFWDMTPDDFNKVPEGFYGPANPSMSQGYFDRLKSRSGESRAEMGAPTEKSPGIVGKVPLSPFNMPATMGQFNERTRVGSKKLVRLAQQEDLLKKGLLPQLSSQVDPTDMQRASHGARWGNYFQARPEDPFYDPSGKYSMGHMTQWGSGGTPLQQNLIRMLAMRGSQGQRADVGTLIYIAERLNDYQSGRISDVEMSKSLYAAKQSLIYGMGYTPEQADASIQMALKSNQSVPFSNTTRMQGGLPQLSQEQWNEAADPTKTSSWWGKGQQDISGTFGQMGKGAPGGYQVTRYNTPGFTSDNNFVPL